MIEKVNRFISETGLLDKRDLLLVALSGGADSVALLRVLLHEGYSCVAAHCNFELRGEESDRDEAFVRALCEELRVPLKVAHFQTRNYAEEKKISIEMAARELRYDWFEKLRLEIGATYIAVAHHQDDSVETFLLNLLRGTGLSGLQGIHARNGSVVRPLLSVTRVEIVDYLAELEQPYVTDSTNLQDEFMRNKIRLNLIPLMQEINPAACDHIAATASILTKVDTVYQHAIQEGKDEVMQGGEILIDRLLQQPEPELLLYEILTPYGFNPVQIHDIFLSASAQSGKQFVGKDRWRLVKDRTSFFLSRESPQEGVKKPDFTLRKEVYAYSRDFVIPRSRDKVCLDSDKLEGELQLRLWQKGDWFVPFGMKGRKLVSDYLTDRKFTLLQKESQWVLTCGDRIVWLVGERADNRFRIDDQTKSVTILTLEPSK